ncbi:MAG: hypothetical protein SGJ09_09155 [Phycisphaerae bacterium]|nr:hypothetical protein [Phycisphaerae bacterium]MDZ4830349.1 hypothetical protein [Phycisphaerae bacterium]
MKLSHALSATVGLMCVHGTMAGDSASGPPVECESCCGEAPAISGFSGRPVLLNTDSGDLPSSLVLNLFDISGFASQGLPSIWAAPRYEDPLWTQATLGSVAGVTADGAGNMYLSHCIWYPVHSLGSLGGDTGAVTRIDGATGTPTLLSNLPQVPVPTFQCPGTSAPPVSPPGLGNLTWSCSYQSLYVTNFEDGRVYRIDPSAPVGHRIKSAWDFATDVLDLSGTDDADWTEALDQPGPVCYGERVWGVAVANGKMFVSQWNRDFNTSGAGSNKIWSVQVDAAGNPVPASKAIEIDLAGLSTQSAVADLAFDADCCLYTAEKSINPPLDLGCGWAHESRLRKFCWQPNPAGGGGVWNQSGNFDVGASTVCSGTVFCGGAQPDSASGGVGVDNGSGGLVWATGDYLVCSACLTPPVFIYGIAGISQSGNINSDYISIDSDGNSISEAVEYDKREIGSCEVICSKCMDVATSSIECKFTDGDPSIPVPGQYTWTFTVTNNSSTTATSLSILSPNVTPPLIPLLPPLGTGDSATVTVTLSNMVANTTGSFDFLLFGSLGQVCCHDVVDVAIPDCDCLRALDSAIGNLTCVGGLASFTYSFTMQNLFAPYPIAHVLLGVQPAGSPVTVSPMYFSAATTPALVPSPLPVYGITSLSIQVANATPGTIVKVEILIHSADFLYCCSEVIEIQVPDCPTALSNCCCANGLPPPGVGCDNRECMSIVCALDPFCCETSRDIVCCDEAALFCTDLCPGGGSGAVRGDLDGDGMVGASDLAILLGNWGGTGVGDLDHDGVVGASDLGLLLSHWG